MTITPGQLCAARGLLGWSVVRLGARTNLSEMTIRAFEKGRRALRPEHLATMRTTLERAGVEFIDGELPGVRLRKR
jgi:transcriptional regulator with XRE-family HTH domain